MSNRRRRPYIVRIDEEDAQDDHDYQPEDREEVGNSSDDEEENEEDAATGDSVLSNVPYDIPSPSSASTPLTEEENGDRRRKARATSPFHRDETGESGQFSQREVDGLCCPICMQVWTSNGEHHVCCLPCGHIYGMSCVKKWFQQCKGSSKCPQCNRKCTMKDVRKLYASRIVTIDNVAQQEIQSLEAKCAMLEAEIADWLRKQSGWRKRETSLLEQVHQLTGRSSLLDGRQKSISGDGSTTDRTLCSAGRGLMMPQEEVGVSSARFFDIDPSHSLLIVVRMHPRTSGLHILTKISLMSPYRSEDVMLSPSLKLIKDLHVSPTGSLALVASLAKKMSVLSLETNNELITYDLPAPAWSCAWDLRSQYHAYAGLQNGTVMLFDTRWTGRCVDSWSSPPLTSRPVHTLTCRAGGGSVLAASSVGACELSFHTGVSEQRMLLAEQRGVCVSLACSPAVDFNGNHLVSVTHRPRLVAEAAAPAPSCGAGNQVQGSHTVLLSSGAVGGGQCSYRVLASAAAMVDDVRLPRSAIARVGDGGRHLLLASPDGAGARQLVLYDLPRLAPVHHLLPHQAPIRDVKFVPTFHTHGLLGCLSESKIHLYTPTDI